MAKRQIHQTDPLFKDAGFWLAFLIRAFAFLSYYCICRVPYFTQSTIVKLVYFLVIYVYFDVLIRKFQLIVKMCILENTAFIMKC